MSVSPVIPISFPILITTFVAVVAPMMLLPLQFPLSVFEFFLHPDSAFISPRRGLQVRQVLGRQPERVERPHIDLTGRRNSGLQLERAYCECSATPVSAVNPASIISATFQLTLHFCDYAHVHLGRRQPRRRAKENLVLAPSSRLAI